MIPQEEYYKAPSQEVFDDIHQAAVQLWSTYSDEFGYRTEKLDRIKGIGNISDNYAYIVAMFDSTNQLKLFTYLKTQEARDLVERLIS
jgi:hypothetical protein